MAKGRKTGSNRHERFLGTFNYINQNPGNGAIDGSELEEEDIWSMVDDIVDSDDQVIHVAANEWSYGEPPGNGGGQRINLNNQIWFEKEDHHHHHHHHRQVGGLSLAFKDSGKAAVSPRIVHQFHGQDNMMASNQRRHNHHHQMAASAPVNVPDWTKILRINSVESLHDLDDGLDDDDNSERVPPHEYVARGSRRNTMTTSVFEGVGRTLKGRDLSRVRDAVWSQTGFDG